MLSNFVLERRSLVFLAEDVCLSVFLAGAEVYLWCRGIFLVQRYIFGAEVYLWCRRKFMVQTGGASPCNFWTSTIDRIFYFIIGILRLRAIDGI